MVALSGRHPHTGQALRFPRPSRELILVDGRDSSLNRRPCDWPARIVGFELPHLLSRGRVPDDAEASYAGEVLTIRRPSDIGGRFLAVQRVNLFMSLGVPDFDAAAACSRDSLAVGRPFN